MRLIYVVQAYYIYPNGYTAQQICSHQNNEYVNTFWSDNTLKKDKDKPKHLLKHTFSRRMFSL